MKPFNPFQTALAISATSAAEAGFPFMADAFVKALRKDLGMAEATPEASKACHVSQNAPNKPSRSYCSFRFTEMDEGELEVVETPRILP